MTDPIRNAQAQVALANAGRTFMGQSFKALADILVSQAGPSFDAAAFAARVGNVQVNRIGHTNEAGETINSLIRVAAGGVWQDAEFQVAAPSDRFRIILNAKFTLYTLDDDDVIGDLNVPAGAAAQLIARGLMRLDRSRGRQTTQRLWQFLAGADNRRFVPGDDAAVEINRFPSETEILPLGFGPHLFAALDAINPNDRTRFTLSGLAGVDVAQAYDGDLGIGVDLIVADAVMSGQ